MVAIYARQSIDKINSLSIEAQIELCRAEIKRDAGKDKKRRNKEDIKVFQDKGFSGKNIKRPAFQELIAAVESGQVEKIYVYRLDRFSRSIVDFGSLWELMDKHGVEFLSVNENFDTSTPMGRAMLNIVLVFAQLERETTAERVKDSYMHRFALGAWPGGPAPYGFSITKIIDNGYSVSSLTANENAETVIKIFREYVKDGVSLRSLAKLLTEEGIHGPKREVWDNVTLSRILHSPLYVCADEDIYWHYLGKGLQIRQPVEDFDGEHACNVIGRRDRSKSKYNSLEGQMLTVANHKGLVPSALWLAVQDKLSGNVQIPRTSMGKYSWLTGLMKCARCGYAIKINYVKKEDKFHLICSGRSNHDNCNATVKIDLRELENYVALAIKNIIADCPPEKIITDTHESIAAVMEIEKKIERLTKAIGENDDIPVGYIKQQIELLHKEKEQLLSATRASQPVPDKLDFDAASFEEKKIIAAEFIDKVLLDDNTANIIWKM